VPSIDPSAPARADPKARVRHLLRLSMSIRAALARGGAADAASRVVCDPLLLGYVFGAIAEASEWSGASACALDDPADLKKMGLLRLALDEALGAPKLTLDALLATWRYEADPEFALGRRLGRSDARADAAPAFERLSDWLSNGRARPRSRTRAERLLF
jgi:hypothetical protein